MTMPPRHVRPRDCERVLAVVDEWWDVPPTSSCLPPVFFSHLASTSFVLEAHDGVLVGFLLGFLSEARPDEACVHMIGVHPAFRRLGFGRRLYERFFVTAQMGGRRYVRAVSQPSDQSIAFHRAMGFVTLGGSGAAPVVFVRRLVHDAPAFEPSQGTEAAVPGAQAHVLCDVARRSPLDAAARVLDREKAGQRP